MRFIVCERKNGCAPVVFLSTSKPCHYKAARFLTLRYQANVKRDEDDRYCRRGSAILYAVVSIPIPERSKKTKRQI
ncbi:hypothetical protein ARMGADRAFT_1014887 [Armillaria gallica]|uniref:Uncharacterized protein n=1 Tax=Armillaria gallica TaxID=47427 RepID=A0A2H3D4U7_ARMGA|nr:hypothetical protein ARMGADRAFT_1014887 [Armillaria gallica]